MPTRVIMPALEMAQETGKLLAWKKKPGEQVSKGEPLLEIETDKAVVEVEAPGDGVLSGVKAAEGDVIPVGQTIGWLLVAGEAIPVESAPAQTGRKTESSASAAAPAGPPAAALQAGAGEVRISPKARRLAKEMGVDISRLRGSGAGGEILAEDVMTAGAGSAAGSGTGASSNAAAGTPAATVGVEKPRTIGRLMAERTTQSWTTAPHFFVMRELDASALVAVHRQMAQEIEGTGGAKPTLTDLLVALVARALAKHPRMNASWADGGICNNAEIHIGLAMAVEDGVVAAVIRNADRTNLAAIAARRRELTERARGGHLQPADIGGATFTISNLGMYDVDAFTAIIVPPQAAILAVGRVADRVVALNGVAVVRPMLSLTLSTDHRVADGARAAQFMKDVAEALRDPSAMERQVR